VPAIYEGIGVVGRPRARYYYQSRVCRQHSTISKATARLPRFVSANAISGRPSMLKRFSSRLARRAGCRRKIDRIVNQSSFGVDCRAPDGRTSRSVKRENATSISRCWVSHHINVKSRSLYASAPSLSVSFVKTQHSLTPS